MLSELRPCRVRREAGDLFGQTRDVVRSLAGLLEKAAMLADIGPEGIQGRDAGLAATLDVGRIEVERSAKQFAADHLDDLRVDALVGDRHLAGKDGGSAANATREWILAVEHRQIGRAHV